MKILMVCLGNICRSPMAEGIMRNKAKTNNITMEIDSCGTGGWHTGEAPDLRAQEYMRKQHLDISGLKARQFHYSDFDRFDVIYAMDKQNLADLKALASNKGSLGKLKLILEESHLNKHLSVPDPYYGGKDGFKQVFELLDEACNSIIQPYL